MNEEISYASAFEELQSLVSEMESGKISVDQLAEKVRRATSLIRICRQKLTSTEEDVREILKELETDTTG